MRVSVAVLLGVIVASCGGGDGGTGGRFTPVFRAADVRVDGSTVTSAVRDVRVCCSGSDVLAAWIEERENDRGIYVRRSGNAGASWNPVQRIDDPVFASATKQDLQLCCTDARVYVAWTDNRFGSRDVFLDQSLDGGRTFERSDTRLGIGLTGQFNHADLDLACRGDRVAVAFRVVENGAVYVGIGGGLGGSFGARVPVDLDPALSRAPALCIDAQFVHVVWQDARNGQDDIYYARSSSGGGGFSVAERIDRDVAGDAASERPRICCDDNRVFVAWVDARNGRRLRFNRSLDRGDSWRTIDLQVDSAPVAPTAVGNFEMSCSGPDLRFAWTDDRNGDLAVWFRRSTNSGLSMGEVERRLSSAGVGDVGAVRLRGDRTRVFVTWSEDTPGLLLFQNSDDRGAGFSPAVQAHATAGILPTPVLYDVCVDGQVALTVFRDVRRAGSLDLWSNATGP